jgi:hypothetical protein
MKKAFVGNTYAGFTEIWNKLGASEFHLYNNYYKSKGIRGLTVWDKSLQNLLSECSSYDVTFLSVDCELAGSIKSNEILSLNIGDFISFQEEERYFRSNLHYQNITLELRNNLLEKYILQIEHILAINNNIVLVPLGCKQKELPGIDQLNTPSTYERLKETIGNRCLNLDLVLSDDNNFEDSYTALTKQGYINLLQVLNLW